VLCAVQDVTTVMTGVAIVLIVIGLLFVFFVALPFVGAWMERRR
jgi:hypothetical protein